MVKCGICELFCQSLLLEVSVIEGIIAAIIATSQLRERSIDLLERATNFILKINKMFTLFSLCKHQLTT